MTHICIFLSVLLSIGLPIYHLVCGGGFVEFVLNWPAAACQPLECCSYQSWWSTWIVLRPRALPFFELFLILESALHVAFELQGWTPLHEAVHQGACAWALHLHSLGHPCALKTSIDFDVALKLPGCTKIQGICSYAAGATPAAVAL